MPSTRVTRSHMGFTDDSEQSQDEASQAPHRDKRTGVTHRRVAVKTAPRMTTRARSKALLSETSNSEASEDELQQNGDEEEEEEEEDVDAAQNTTIRAHSALATPARRQGPRTSQAFAESWQSGATETLFNMGGTIENTEMRVMMLQSSAQSLLASLLEKQDDSGWTLSQRDKVLWTALAAHRHAQWTDKDFVSPRTVPKYLYPDEASHSPRSAAAKAIRISNVASFLYYLLKLTQPSFPASDAAATLSEASAAFTRLVLTRPDVVDTPSLAALVGLKVQTYIQRLKSGSVRDGELENRFERTLAEHLGMTAESEVEIPDSLEDTFKRFSLIALRKIRQSHDGVAGLEITFPYTEFLRETFAFTRNLYRSNILAQAPFTTGNTPRNNQLAYRASVPVPTPGPSRFAATPSQLPIAEQEEEEDISDSDTVAGMLMAPASDSQPSSEEADSQAARHHEQVASEARANGEAYAKLFAMLQQNKLGGNGIQEESPIKEEPRVAEPPPPVQSPLGPPIPSPQAQILAQPQPPPPAPKTISRLGFLADGRLASISGPALSTKGKFGDTEGGVTIGWDDSQSQSQSQSQYEPDSKLQVQAATSQGRDSPTSLLPQQDSGRPVARLSSETPSEVNPAPPPVFSPGFAAGAGDVNMRGSSVIQARGDTVSRASFARMLADEPTLTAVQKGKGRMVSEDEDGDEDEDEDEVEVMENNRDVQKGKRRSRSDDEDEESHIPENKDRQPAKKAKLSQLSGHSGLQGKGKGKAVSDGRAQEDNGGFEDESDEESDLDGAKARKIKDSRANVLKHPAHRHDLSSDSDDDDFAASTDSVANLPKPTRSFGKLSRNEWTRKEEELLKKEVKKHYTKANCMAHIIKLHGPEGQVSQILALRNGVSLKDKAVNMNKRWERDGTELAPELKKAFARFKKKS